MELLMDEKTDEDIALKVQKGDIQLFGILVDRYQAKLLRYGRKFLSSSHDIEDLVQDIFIKAYKNIRSFNIKMRFSPWIYRIAHNEFINTIQKIKRMPLLTFDFDQFLPYLFSKETADREVNEKDTKAMLNNGLAKIDRKYREPLILYYLEEMNYREISEILRIPVSTVGIRLKRGRASLKKVLE
jgi:RNA polymerase sigma-70 factor (ECF subfamily)